MDNHAEVWFSDFQTDNVKLSIRLDRQLFSADSEFQHIDVFQSPAFGLGAGRRRDLLRGR